MKLEREIERWALVEPSAIAQSSCAAIMFLVSDAKRDIAALASALAAKDAEIERLREELACTIEEIIEHSGDDMGDSRSRRAAELRAALNPEASHA